MIFPIKLIPLYNFAFAPAKFGSRRDNGKRKHAGVDLYCPEDTPVYAMESGVVCNVYNFYSATDACSISGEKYMIRYGEMKFVIKAGAKVKEGQLIGYVKKCQGVNQAMLHIEFYSNPLDRSSLTVKDRPPYQRRSDLIDPTEILLELYSKMEV